MAALACMFAGCSPSDGTKELDMGRKAYEVRDLKKAEKGMKQVCDIVDILVQYGGVAGGKAMMAVWGLDMGGVRLPNVSLSDEAKADCVARLKKIGFK